MKQRNLRRHRKKIDNDRQLTQDLTNRDNFFLHGGSLPSSAGCIDIGGGLCGNQQTDQLLADLQNDSDGIVELQVVKPQYELPLNLPCPANQYCRK